MSREAKPGDKVELADKDTGFYDSETQFDISRDQQVELGERIGAKTLVALSSGGLLLVGSGRKAEKKSE